MPAINTLLCHSTDYATKTALCPWTVIGMTGYSKTERMNSKTQFQWDRTQVEAEILRDLISLLQGWINKLIRFYLRVNSQ